MWVEGETFTLGAGTGVDRASVQVNLHRHPESPFPASLFPPGFGARRALLDRVTTLLSWSLVSSQYLIYLTRRFGWYGNASDSGLCAWEIYLCFGRDANLQI